MSATWTARNHDTHRTFDPDCRLCRTRTPRSPVAYEHAAQALAGALEHVLTALARLEHPDRDIAAAQLLHEVGLWVDRVDYVVGLEATAW